MRKKIQFIFQYSAKLHNMCQIHWCFYLQWLISPLWDALNKSMTWIWQNYRMGHVEVMFVVWKNMILCKNTAAARNSDTDVTSVSFRLPTHPPQEAEMISWSELQFSLCSILSAFFDHFSKKYQCILCVALPEYFRHNIKYTK